MVFIITLSWDLFFPQSNNTLEAVCSIENEARDFIVCLAVRLKVPWG